MEKTLEDYFELDEINDCVRFTGDTLHVYIPRRYETLNFLFIEEQISTLGIFKFVINKDTETELEAGLNLPALITMDADESYNETIDDEKYLCAVLHNGSRLLTSLHLVKNDKLYFLLWREFMSLGKIPLFINYENIAFMFDDLKEICGKGISTDHALLEMIYAHIYRDSDDLNKPYRLTSKQKPPEIINLRNVSYGPSGTFSKIAGSFAQDGYNSALLNQTDKNNELEDLWRQ